MAAMNMNAAQHMQHQHPQANYQMPPEGRWVSTLPRTGKLVFAEFCLHVLYNMLTLELSSNLLEIPTDA